MSSQTLSLTIGERHCYFLWLSSNTLTSYGGNNLTFIRNTLNIEEYKMQE